MMGSERPGRGRSRSRSPRGGGNSGRRSNIDGEALNELLRDALRQLAELLLLLGELLRGALRLLAN